MDIHKIRENPELIKENQRRRFLNDTVVDEIMKLDIQGIQTEFQRNRLRNAKNIITASFKNSIHNTEGYKYDPADIDALFDAIPKLTTGQLREVAKIINNQITELETLFERQITKRNSLIYSLGN